VLGRADIRVSTTQVVLEDRAMRHRFIVTILSCLLAGCVGPQPASQDENRPLSKNPPNPFGVKPFGAGEPQAVLLVTGGDNGMLEVCSCAGEMAGNLSKRSGLVLSYRAAYSNTLLVDAGDGFALGNDSLLNDFHVRAFRQIGYDAMVLGDQEWGVSAGRLHGMLAQGKMAYLSTTARDTPDPQGRSPLPLTQVVKREFGPVKLAVLSDLAVSALGQLPPERRAELTFAREGELNDLAGGLRKEGYLVVVVCHGDEEALRLLAETCPADLFVREHKSKAQPQLSKVSGKPVMTIGGYENVGVVGIRLGADGRIADIEYRLEPADKRWPTDDRLVQTYRDYTQLAMQAAKQEKPRPGLDYASSAECGKCHTAQLENWKAAKHSHAWQTLVRERRTDDPACLVCHTSGFGTVKGFRSMETTPQLANVNCQDCHRVDFTVHAKTAARTLPVTEATCRRCHTDVTDPRFDYSVRVGQYHCPTTRPASATIPTTLPGN
jgi:hypothetical protein